MTTTTCTRKAFTTWTYSCGCDDCQRQAYRVRKLARAGLLWAAPAEEMRAAALARIREWIDAGWTCGAIASAVGVPTNTASQWMAALRTNSRPMRIGAWKCEAILTAGPPTRGYIPATVATRQLRALTRMGWNGYALAEHSGVARSTICTIRAAQQKRCAATHALAIDATFTALAYKPGGCAESERRAILSRWPAAAAWEDIRDPNEPTPDTQRRTGRHKTDVDPERVKAACNGERDPDLTHAERVVIVNQLTAAGLTPTQIQRLTGISKAERHINHHEQETAA